MLVVVIGLWAFEVELLLMNGFLSESVITLRAAAPFEPSSLHSGDFLPSLLLQSSAKLLR